jgi:hypothetical protein
MKYSLVDRVNKMTLKQSNARASLEQEAKKLNKEDEKYVRLRVCGHILARYAVLYTTNCR